MNDKEPKEDEDFEAWWKAVCSKCGKEIKVEDAFNIMETSDGLAHIGCVCGV